MIMWASKGGIGRSKLTQVKERIFDGDGRGGYMHKQCSENEGAATIF